MPTKSPRTPKSTVKVRRPLKPGDVIMVPATVTGTRTMRPDHSAVDREAVTFRIPGYSVPVTVNRDELEPGD